MFSHFVAGIHIACFGVSGPLPTTTTRDPSLTTTLKPYPGGGGSRSELEENKRKTIIIGKLQTIPLKKPSNFYECVLDTTCWWIFWEMFWGVDIKSELALFLASYPCISISKNCISRNVKCSSCSCWSLLMQQPQIKDYKTGLLYCPGLSLVWGLIFSKPLRVILT